MLVIIHSRFIRYKSLAHDQIRAYDWAIPLMNINEFLKIRENSPMDCLFFPDMGTARRVYFFSYSSVIVLHRLL